MGCTCYSQVKKYTIVDSSTKSAVEFAAIKLGNDNGIYTDKSGTFFIDLNLNLKVEVSHISYETKDFNLSNIKDTLKLNPKAFQLDEVKIDKSNQKLKVFKNTNRKAKMAWPLFLQTEFIVFAKPTKKVIGTTVQEVKFYCKVNEARTKGVSSAVLKMTAYSYDKKQLYSIVEQIPIADIINNGIVYALNEDIPFNMQGLFFGIELIGWYNNQNVFVNNDGHIDFVGLLFANNKEWNTYYRNPFHTDMEWLLINGNNKLLEYYDSKPKGIKFDLKLAVD